MIITRILVFKIIKLGHKQRIKHLKPLEEVLLSSIFTQEKIFLRFYWENTVISLTRLQILRNSVERLS